MACNTAVLRQYINYGSVRRFFLFRPFAWHAWSEFVADADPARLFLTHPPLPAARTSTSTCHLVRGVDLQPASLPSLSLIINAVQIPLVAQTSSSMANRDGLDPPRSLALHLPARH